MIHNKNPPKDPDWDVWCTFERLDDTRSTDNRSSSHNNDVTTCITTTYNDGNNTCNDNTPAPTALVTHTGGCHCGAIRFTCTAPSHLILYDCNCSDCRLRKNVHFIIPFQQLELDTNAGTSSTTCNGNNEDSCEQKKQRPMMTEYRWGTGAARHFFCSVCGITPYYVPRSNPNGYAVTFACLDGGSVESFDVKRFDGRHWEEFVAGDGGKGMRGFA